jgi:hypothetical protein
MTPMGLPEIVSSIREIESRARLHPATDFLDKLSRLETSHFVYRNNHKDLKDYLNQVIAAGSYLLNPARMWESHPIHLELARLLHNYVAAAISLRDHSLGDYRTIFSYIGGEERHRAIIDELMKHKNLIEFVVKLRNYSQHDQLPITRNGFSFMEGRYFVSLVKSSLLKSRKAWSAPAREFINESDDDIYLDEVIDKYHNCIVSFHESSISLFYELFQSPLSELFKIRDERMILVAEKMNAEVKEALSEHPKQAIQHIQFALASMLEPVESRGLMHLLPDLPSWVEAALPIAAAHASTPRDLIREVESIIRAARSFATPS